MTKYFPFKTKWDTPEYFKVLEVSGTYLKNCKNVLDLGCGRGESTYFLEKNNIKATGVDVRKMEAWEFFPNNDFRVYDGKNLEFENNYFDGVLLNNVVEHIKDKELFFNEIKRVCKKNSKVVIIVPNLFWKVYHMIMLPKHFIAFLRGYGLGMNYWFVHAKEVYGNNFIKEDFDFANWHKITSEFIIIENEKNAIKRRIKIFFGKLKNQ